MVWKGRCGEGDVEKVVWKGRCGKGGGERVMVVEEKYLKKML